MSASSDAADRLAIIDLLKDLGTSELESFFGSHGLGEAFAAPSRGWGRLKRVNAALLEAERRGDLERIFAAIRTRYGGATPTGEPVSAMSKLRFELHAIEGEMDATEGWKYADTVEAWRDRLNQVLDHLRAHLGQDAVTDDFALSPREYSRTSKTITENGFGRLRRAVAVASEIAGVPAGPRSPVIRDGRLDSLHPAIKSASESLFLDGHGTQAILEAFKAVNNKVKRRSGLRDDGRSLMARAFDEKRPILRLNRGQSVSDLDEQEGFRFIFMGVMQGIRNPRAHDETVEPDVDRALEYLGLASLLMRRLDEATGGVED